MRGIGSILTTIFLLIIAVALVGSAYAFILGYFNAIATPITCPLPDRDVDSVYSSQCGGTDCNDGDKTVYPGAPEVCDKQDNQCTGNAGFGQIDEGCPILDVENNEIKLLFAQQPGVFTLSSITNKRTGFVQTFSPVPLVTIVLKNIADFKSGKGKTETEYTLDQYCNPTTSLFNVQNGQEFIVQYLCTLPMGYIELNFSALVDTSPFTHWRVRSKNNFQGSGLSLSQVRIGFGIPNNPQVKEYIISNNVGSGIEVEEPAINLADTLVCGPGSGACGTDPSDVICASGQTPRCTITGEIDNLKTGGLQLFPFYRSDGNSLYLATDDPESTTSRRQVLDGNGIDFLLSHYEYVPNDLEEVNTFISLYNLTVGVYKGDWWDAAQIYRAWVKNTPILAQGPLETRTDIPQWWKENDAVILGVPIVNQYDFTLQSDRDRYVNGFLRMKNYYGIQDGKLAIFFFSWYGGIGDYSPSIIPGFDLLVKQFEANNIHVILYSLIQGAADTSSFWSTYGLDGGTMKDGTGARYLVNAQYWSNVYGIDPSYGPWQQAYAQDIAIRQIIQTMGATAIYYDNPYGLKQGDYDAYYGGSRRNTYGRAGSDLFSGYRDLMETVRTAARQVNPDFISFYERTHEAFIPSTEQIGTWGLVAQTGGNDLMGNHLAFRGIPLTDSIYHDYIITFGANEGPDYLKLLPNYVDNYNVYLIPSVWGKSVLTEESIFDAGEDCMNFELASPSCYGAAGQVIVDHAQFLKDIIEERRNARSFLVYGQLLKPPVTDSPLQVKTLQDYYGNIFNVQFPVVMSAIWRSSSGGTGLYLLNYNSGSGSDTLTVQLPLRNYGLNYGVQYGLFKVLSGGLSLTTLFSGDTSLTLSVGKLSADFYEIIQLPTVTGFDGATTVFSTETDIRSVSNAILEKSTIGKVSLQGTTSFEALDLAGDVVMSLGRISIDPLLPLHLPAIIEMRGLTLSNPQILKNSAPCPPTECIIQSYSGGVLTFTVLDAGADYQAQ